MNAIRRLDQSDLLDRYLRARYGFLRESEIEIALSFAEEVSLVGMVDVEEQRYFLGAFAEDRYDRPDPDHFDLLTREENLSIDRDRGFRLYEPWPQPVLGVLVGPDGSGTVMGAERRVRVVMREVASAQVWYASPTAVLWEVVVHRNTGALRTSLFRAMWTSIEAHLQSQGIERVVTLPFDPGFEPDAYAQMLHGLGYTRYEQGFEKSLRPIQEGPCE